ncbi:MAG: proline dehydrogenase family protein [Anaerolineae bacterium]|nr:proline dehydrogenase family protein [Anaerolineae bacterium]
MMRAILLYLSHAGWARRIMLHWRLARRVARLWVAGETLSEAVTRVKAMNERGLTATVDVLGEAVTHAEDTAPPVAGYLDLIDAIRREGLQAGASLKLTALGLDIDPELCHTNMLRILERAREAGVRITIDMEDSNHTQATLDMFRRLRAGSGADLHTVIQSYLYRSDADIEALAAEGAGIRLCKGAYMEPPDRAYPAKRDVNAAFVRQAKMLLDAAKAGRGYPGFATHDENMIAAVRAYAAEQGIGPALFEFQMLYGVRSNLQAALVAEGYRMRLYEPYGTQWYPYFMRRLAERPANVWFFASSLLRG